MLDFSKLSLNATEPVYIQINRFVKRQIFLGQAEKGEPLPSRRELASRLKINPNTAQKAVHALEEEGLVLTPKNSVSILYFDEEMLEEIQREMRGDLVAAFVKEAKENRLKLTEIIALIEKAWKEGDGR